MHHLRFAIAFCVAALTTFTSSAQQNAAPQQPTDSRLAVPAVQYESAFSDFAPFRDEKLAPWRDVNEEAARVGGHIGIIGGAGGHAGHGAAKPTVKPSASAPLVPPPTAPHTMPGGGHEGMKK